MRPKSPPIHLLSLTGGYKSFRAPDALFVPAEAQPVGSFAGLKTKTSQAELNST